MKLIIREYLASLRERNELDSLLPALLSQMGLEVFSKPGVGNRQYGVDVAAYGSIEEGAKKVYLFSVKSGDLGRRDWNSGSVQDLRPSLDEIRYLLHYDEPYPCHLHQYHELLDHPQKDEDGYKDRVTKASILYPYIATFSALFGFDDIYAQIQELKKDQLSHCNFKFWYPDETSEEHHYIYDDMHGATLSHLPIEEDQNSFLDIIFKECGESNHFEELTAIQYGVWPLILMAARHYRLPVPVNYLKDYWQQKPAN